MANSLTPTRPTVSILLNELHIRDMLSRDAAANNLATRALVIFLQENVGNQYGVPVTFHEKLMALDQEVEGAVMQDVVDYVLMDNLPREHAIDAMLLVTELCKADSNKLAVVVDRLIPIMVEWMASGSAIEQHTVSHLAAMAANRFDLADRIIDSDVLGATIELFQAVRSTLGNFSDDSTEQGFRQDRAMPTTVLVAGRILPRHLKMRHRVKSHETAVLGTDRRAESLRGAAPAASTSSTFEAEDDGGGSRGGGGGGGAEQAGGMTDIVETDIKLDREPLERLQGDIMFHCVQIIAELAGASRAVGRRKLLDAGGLDMIKDCVALHSRASSGNFTVHVDVMESLLEEACHAAHASLSGRFGLEDIRHDTDFSKYWDAIAEWKAGCVAEKDWTAEFKFDLGMTPLERRKAHIICAFHNLSHNSVGGVGNRRVIAEMQQPEGAELEVAEEEKMMNPLAAAANGNGGGNGDVGAGSAGAEEAELEEKERRAVAERRAAEGLNTGGKQPWEEWDELDIYKWNWQAVVDTGITTEMISLSKSSSPDLRFCGVDLLTKIVEHQLEDADRFRNQNSDEILAIMIDALMNEASDRPLKLLGATGCATLVSNRGVYMEYGTRAQRLKGKKLFCWAGRMFADICWWNLNAGGMPELLSGETGFAF
eukprot:SAG22_NODE_422_length_10687_cov_4.448149_2_plen_655_part_00